MAKPTCPHCKKTDFEKAQVLVSGSKLIFIVCANKSCQAPIAVLDPSVTESLLVSIKYLKPIYTNTSNMFTNVASILKKIKTL
jgi:hypothetical protein